MNGLWIAWLQLLLVITYPIQDGVGQAEEPAINVACHGDNIMVELKSELLGEGMLYVDGQSMNKPCRMELSKNGLKTYKLPLKSCNTVLRNVSEGVEFSNTILVQPHRKLITKNGKSFHIRCLYRTMDGTVTSDFIVSSPDVTPVSATAQTPVCSMTIFIGGKPNGFPVDRVHTGDLITMVVSMDTEQAYTFKVTDCVVQNGDGDVSQNLVDDQGCPIEPEIMGEFDYSDDASHAMVSFNAHRFPDSNIVNYQCMVQMCLKSVGQQSCAVDCAENSTRRRKREEISSGRVEELSDRGPSPSVMVFRGLLVNDGGVELGESPSDPDVIPEMPEKCLEYRAINLGLIIACTMLLILLLIFISLLIQRSGTKRMEVTRSGSRLRCSIDANSTAELY